MCKCGGVYAYIEFFATLRIHVQTHHAIFPSTFCTFFLFRGYGLEDSKEKNYDVYKWNKMCEENSFLFFRMEWEMDGSSFTFLHQKKKNGNRLESSKAGFFSHVWLIIDLICWCLPCWKLIHHRLFPAHMLSNSKPNSCHLINPWPSKYGQFLSPCAPIFSVAFFNKASLPPFFNGNY